MASVTLARPVAQQETGLMSWLTTVDHKRIGILYIITTFVFFLLGGLEALAIRLQLMSGDSTLLSLDQYNQIFTMHGTTMVFLFVIPMMAGLGNYLVPLMVGARDMAFPRMNALSYWLLLFGGILLYTSFLTGGASDVGWTGYTPLSNREFSPGHGVDYWIVGLALLGTSSLGGAVNFLVTILRMRAPGMTLNRMPLFVWAILTYAGMVLMATPMVTVALILLLTDRNFGTTFFSGPDSNPLLWQHMFWFYSHPAVYIMVLPAFGIVSEVLPVFSSKPIFGYKAIAYSSAAIGFLGFLTWAHHMFTTGISPALATFFILTSMVIAVPTGVKIFNWIATTWRGHVRLHTPMLFSLGLIAVFTIGGLTGIFLASTPLDLQLHDTYFVVAHLHYVLFGGAVFGIFSGLYYWFPKMTGRMMGEGLGKLHFWLLLIGFNLTFFPMHILGIEGMPRRIATYRTDVGYEGYNQLATAGALLIGIAVLVYMVNVFRSLAAGKQAGDDPWNGNTLEWATSSPPPVYNFAVIPTVRRQRPMRDLRLSAGEADREAHAENE